MKSSNSKIFFNSLTNFSAFSKIKIIVTKIQMN